MGGREQRGELGAAGFGQALGAEHEPVAHRLGQLAGARPGQAVALVMVAGLARRRVGLELGGARLRAARYFDLKRRDDRRLGNGWTFATHLRPWNGADLGGPRRVLAAILNSVRARAGAGAVPLHVAETLRYAPDFPAPRPR